MNFKFTDRTLTRLHKQLLAPHLLEASDAFLRTAETAELMENDKWWDELSPEGKHAYVKDHPGSKFAKKFIEERRFRPTEQPGPKIPSSNQPKEELKPKVSVRSNLTEALPDKSYWPEHIKKLGIPPAWHHVHYSMDPEADLLAIGKDAKDRDQYVYSDKYAKSQAAVKFARIHEMHEKRDEISNQIGAAQSSAIVREKDHGDCTRLIFDMGLRPGSEEDTGAEEQAFGATTLRGQHVIKQGDKTFLSFVGKKGVKINLPVEDSQIAEMLNGRAHEAGESGKLFPNINAKSLLDFTHKLDGGNFRTKDMRTLKGTSEAFKLVQQMEPPKDAKDYKRKLREVAIAVSKHLGNTPAVALSSYISPTVFAPWSAFAQEDEPKPENKVAEEKQPENEHATIFDDKWWSKLTTDEQREYIAKHPKTHFKLTFKSKPSSPAAKQAFEKYWNGLKNNQTLYKPAFQKRFYEEYENFNKRFDERNKGLKPVKKSINTEGSKGYHRIIKNLKPYNQANADSFIAFHHTTLGAAKSIARTGKLRKGNNGLYFMLKPNTSYGKEWGDTMVAVRVKYADLLKADMIEQKSNNEDGDEGNGVIADSDSMGFESVRSIPVKVVGIHTDQNKFRLKEQASDAFLRSAIKHGNKIYAGHQGEYHGALQKRYNIPFEESTRGFLNHKNQFLKKDGASRYAQDNDLSDPAYTWNDGFSDPYTTSETLKKRKFPKDKIINIASLELATTQNLEIAANSGLVHHFTSIPTAHKILNDNHFRLSTTLGTNSDAVQGKEPFFLSTTRSKREGRFHQGNQNGVMFNLQADHLANNHKVKPVDYWADPKQPKLANRPFGNEYEERVFSHKSTIDIPEKPTRLIHSIHVLQPDNYEWKHNTRKLMLNAKRRGIPISLYNDTDAWKNQDASKALHGEHLTNALKGVEPPDWGHKKTNWLKPYFEMHYKPAGSVLSKKAKDKHRRLYSMDAATSLQADIHNDKNDPTTAKLVSIIKKHGGIQSFIDHLYEKHSEDFVGPHGKFQADKKNNWWTKMNKREQQEYIAQHRKTKKHLEAAKDKNSC